MNDRYLFRGKRLDNGKWVQGFLLTSKLGNYHILPYGYYIDRGISNTTNIDPATLGPLDVSVMATGNT